MTEIFVKTVGDVINWLQKYDTNTPIYCWDCEYHELRQDIQIGDIEGGVAIKSCCLTDFEEMKDFHWSIKNDR